MEVCSSVPVHPCLPHLDMQNLPKLCQQLVTRGSWNSYNISRPTKRRIFMNQGGHSNGRGGWLLLFKSPASLLLWNDFLPLFCHYLFLLQPRPWISPFPLQWKSFPLSESCYPSSTHCSFCFVGELLQEPSPSLFWVLLPTQHDNKFAHFYHCGIPYIFLVHLKNRNSLLASKGVHYLA